MAIHKLLTRHRGLMRHVIDQNSGVSSTTRVLAGMVSARGKYRRNSKILAGDTQVPRPRCRNKTR